MDLFRTKRSLRRYGFESIQLIHKGNKTGDKLKRCLITQVGQKLIGKRTGNGAKNRSSTSRIKNYVCVGGRGA